MAARELDTGEGPVRIAVVDHCYAVQKGLELIIAELTGYTVTLTAQDGKDLDFRHGNAVPVHIAIVDMHDGVEAIQWIRSHWPDTRVLAKSEDRSAAAMHAALRAGACGFIPDNFSHMLLHDALDGVRLRGCYHDDSLIRLQSAAPPLDLSTRLRPVLLQVLDCVCTDDEPTWQMVADRLCKSKPTIDTHQAALFKLLGVRSKAGLVSLGRSQGFGKGRYWPGPASVQRPEASGTVV